jgi:hypothetical protein
MATAEQIQQLYQQYLGREADPSGLSYWQNFQGDPTAAFLAGAEKELGKDIVNEQNVAEVQSAYEQLFGRDADPEGLLYWANTGLTGSELQNAMAKVASGQDVPALRENQPYGVGNNLMDVYRNLNTGLTTSKDPYIQAAQQTALGNLQSAQATTAANRVNQVTPFGNLTYTQTGTDSQGNPVWSATQTFAPEYQQAFGNLAQQVGQTTAQGFQPNVPSVGINPGETYEAAIMRRLEPVQARERESLEAQLANQGIMPGSEAYSRAKEQLSQAQNDQRTSAVVGGFNTGLAANQAGFNQQLAQYQLPIGTLANLRTATNPNYVSPYMQQVTAGPDYLTSYNLGQQNEIARQAAAQSGQNAITGGLFDIGSTILSSKAGGSLIDKGISAIGSLFSDIRMKEKINLIGKTLSGINLYEFEYKPEFKEIAGEGKFVGVMAQEVEKVIPEAVIETSIGYKAVDYSKIH